MFAKTMFWVGILQFGLLAVTPLWIMVMFPVLFLCWMPALYHLVFGRRRQRDA